MDAGREERPVPVTGGRRDEGARARPPRVPASAPRRAKVGAMAPTSDLKPRLRALTLELAVALIDGAAAAAAAASTDAGGRESRRRSERPLACALRRIVSGGWAREA